MEGRKERRSEKQLQRERERGEKERNALSAAVIAARNPARGCSSGHPNVLAIKFWETHTHTHGLGLCW